MSVQVGQERTHQEEEQHADDDDHGEKDELRRTDRQVVDRTVRVKEGQAEEDEDSLDDGERDRDG